MSKEFLQAEQEIPPVFYEEYFVHHSLAVLTAVAVSVGYLANNNLSPMSMNVKDEKDALIRIAAVATVTIGSIMDIFSSVKISDQVEQGLKIGMGPYYQESNPLFGDLPKKDGFHSLKNLHGIFSLSSPVLAAYAPIFGLVVGLGRGFAALNNERKAKRLKRAIEIKKKSLL